MKICLIAVILFVQINFLFAQKFKIDSVHMPVSTSIRAMKALNDSAVWLCGSGGVFAYTEDAGVNWYIDSLRINSDLPDYRAIDILDNNAVIMANAGSPAVICKTTDGGRNWSVVYSDVRPEIFIDAISFVDTQNGIALADPIANQPVILITHDGGESWKDASSELLFETKTGEAFFAASNSCMHYEDSLLSFVSGGTVSNYYSCNFKSYTVTVTPLPIISGNSLQGAFTMLKFGDTLVIAGGDYERPDTNCNRLAISYNRGVIWQPIKTDIPFISSLCFLKNRNLLFAACMPGIYVSANLGRTWKKIAHESINILYASPTENKVYAAGRNGCVIKINIE